MSKSEQHLQIEALVGKTLQVDPEGETEVFIETLGIGVSHDPLGGFYVWAETDDGTFDAGGDVLWIALSELEAVVEQEVSKLNALRGTVQHMRRKAYAAK